MPKIEFRAGGTSAVVDADARDTILDSALRNKVDARYSCLEGVCETCRALLVEGETEHAKGGTFILTCQERPKKGVEKLIVDYDAEEV